VDIAAQRFGHLDVLASAVGVAVNAPLESASSPLRQNVHPPQHPSRRQLTHCIAAWCR
jgi:hypothetical protein